jgi:hypothetical protein
MAPARGMASTALALGSVTLMLTIVDNAGVTGAAPTGLIVTAMAAMLAVVLVCGAVRLMGGRMPRETETRFMLETAGMLTVATPVALVVAIATGWIG